MLFKKKKLITTLINKQIIMNVLFFYLKDFKCCVKAPEPTGCFKEREQYSLYLLSEENTLRKVCKYIMCQKWFDYTILFFIALNCITLAMERPTIPPHSLVTEEDFKNKLLYLNFI